MKKNKGEEIIYEINVNDLQEVANQVLDRRLTSKEVALVQGTVGDYIDWSQAIENAIQKHIRT